MKFEKQFTVGVKDVGKSKQMTNYAFLSFLEEIASFHSNLCGYGVNDIDTKGKAWILMDWKLKVIKRPKYAEEITIKTWARPIEKHVFFTYRDFEVFCKGEKVAIASSKWVLLDVNSKKLSKITEDIFKEYKPEDINVFEEKEILKIKEAEENDLKLIYEVKRADIDMIKHMHNLNYLSLAYEALPEESYENLEKSNIRIMYKHQILLGNKVKCYYAKQGKKELISLKSEDGKVLHAIIELS